MCHVKGENVEQAAARRLGGVDMRSVAQTRFQGGRQVVPASFCGPAQPLAFQRHGQGKRSYVTITMIVYAIHGLGLERVERR